MSGVSGEKKQRTRLRAAEGEKEETVGRSKGRKQSS